MVGSLAAWLAAGILDAPIVLAAVQELAGQHSSPKPLLVLLEALDRSTDPALSKLAAHLRHKLRRSALQFHQKWREGLLLSEEDKALLQGLNLDLAEPWHVGADIAASVEAAIATTRAVAFLTPRQNDAPTAFRLLEQSASTAVTEALKAINPQIERLSPINLSQLEPGWPPNLPGRDAVLSSLRARASIAWEKLAHIAGLPIHGRSQTEPALPEEFEDGQLLNALAAKFALAESREEKCRWLDAVCAWPRPIIAAALEKMTLETWAQDRAVLSLTLRFGQPLSNTRQNWLHWLAAQERLWQAEQESFRQLLTHRPQEILFILYSALPAPDSATLEQLLYQVLSSGPVITPQDLMQSWATFIPVAEQRALLGWPPPSSTSLPPVIAEFKARATYRAPLDPAQDLRSQATPAGPSSAPPPIPTPAVSPAPPKPSLWEKHIQPLFVENWYIVAGIAMVILGSSLLAYYTWDKHWLVRYTIMPLLLGLFTWSLAGVGSWIEKKGTEFKSTAAMLRGAAIGLLPINFMALALLSADETVPQKGPALVTMALIYLALFGWGLRKWCAAVEPSLRNRLAAALLLLNALVALGPVAQTLGHLAQQQVLIVIGTGFYLGFLLAATTVVHFTRRTLTREMAEEKRVPWFVGAALGITYIQVFIWVHSFMRYVPQAHTYALLIIATGWVVLQAERRALELRQDAGSHGGESFLGFAFIMLGVLMGFTQPTMRILCFLTAGAAWMYQALVKRHPLHYWIALTLWALGVAAIGLLPRYPGPWLPLLGLVLAVGFGLGGRLVLGATQRQETPPPGSNEDLATACRGMQVVALVLSTIVSPLVQWHYRSAPVATAGWLLGVAALLAWRSFKDRKLHWLHATMAVLALVLPYAGFVDMAGRTAHHNTMVFGLALLAYFWLGLTRFVTHPVESEPSRITHHASHEGSPLAQSSAKRMPSDSLALRARSTVLWLYGSLAVAAMLLRVALGDTAPSPLWYRDFMDYTGPMLMTFALMAATYYSRSLVPAGMAVVIMAVLFPELKANLQRSFPWLSWGSGLASSLCGLALVWSGFFLRKCRFLSALPEGDRFMDRDLFPLRRYDHTLFTCPILAAALFLIIKVDTWNLLHNFIARGVPLKTAVALAITGLAWTWFGIYSRGRREAIFAIHLGWIWVLAGITLGYWRQAEQPRWSWPFLAIGLIVQGSYWLCRFSLQKRWPWVRELLTEPYRIVLVLGSATLAVICVVALMEGGPLSEMQWLFGFLAAQMVWHSLATRKAVFGTILFFQWWMALLVTTAPGEAPLWSRLSVEQSLTPTLWLLVGIQVLFVLLELLVRTRSTASLSGPAESGTRWNASLPTLLWPLLSPAFMIVSGLAVLLGLAGLVDGVHFLSLSAPQKILVLIALLLTARAHGSSFILLWAMLLSYEVCHRASLATLPNWESRIQFLATPWRLAVLGVTMILLTQAGRWLHRRRRGLIFGRFAQPFFAASSPGWTFCPALVICAVAAGYHAFHPDLRESPQQLWAPYLGALGFALVAWFWNQSGVFAGTGVLLLLGNIHLVRVFGGEYLRSHGLSELHLICLGIGLTLVQASIARRYVRAARAVAAMNQASLGLAFAILALLSANYFTEPNLAAITSTRFIVSGALAWLAGWYFRRAARHPGPGEAAHVDVCEALYHFGVVLAIWCAALLAPPLRKPFLTLVALGLPAVWFYLRAELGTRTQPAEARRYRNSAATLGFVILALYLFKGVFHLVLFPGTPIGSVYYHYNAPVILALGLMLLRLHGLGGTDWLAFYGGLALMTGSYFLLTAIPGLSPFDYPMPSAWCAIGLGHFWILLTQTRSPLRTFWQRLSNLDDPSWNSLSRYWNLCLIAASHAATFLAFSDYSSASKMVAPLLAGAASLLAHQGFLRLSMHDAAGSPSSKAGMPYFVLAGLEFLVALHVDFLVPSYLQKDQVVWALLGAWLVLLATHQLMRVRFSPQTVEPIAFALAALVLAHIFYHRPWSTTGLWAAALTGLLAASTPQPRRQASNAVELACASVLLWIPAWLVYFSQVSLDHQEVGGALEPWPILVTTMTIFLTGHLVRLFATLLAPRYNALGRTQFRLFDSLLTWLQSPSVALKVYQFVLWLALLVVVVAQLLHYGAAFTSREMLVLLLLEAGLAFSWFYEGKIRQCVLAFYLMQISAAAFFASLRRHLMLTAGPWNYEYDVWASLTFSFALAGGKQVLDFQPKQPLRAPLLTTMFLLPALAIVWVVVHGLGTNMALLVVGLHSVMFAYLGKEERESPYNILALAGFVAFILLTFYSKLHLRAVHAYIIPVGLGILVLQELFRERIQPEARNWIRLITLMAMLGSSAYYALVDSRHPITFNLTLIILCLLAMGLGSLLRIRLYLALGFAGLIVDLISILYKVLVLMERNARMTIIGSLVLLIGAALVFGAIYYKTNRTTLDARLGFFRRKLGQWE